MRFGGISFEQIRRSSHIDATSGVGVALDYRGLLREMHEQLTAGRSDLIIASLRKLNPEQIPRDFALEFATLARRTNQIKLGLRILRPIVFSVSSFESPTPLEAAEYAILLFKNGSLAEARNIMNDLEGDTLLDLNFYDGLTALSQYDYNAAITPLNRFIATGPPGVTQLTAKVRLATALLGADADEEAEPLLISTIHETEKIGHRELTSDCLELLAQLQIRKNQLDAAAELLTRAENNRLFVTKWRAIINAHRTKSTEPLIVAAHEALRCGQGEMLRDLDRHSLTVSFDADLYARLFCGTPHLAFRRRLLQTFSEYGLRPVNCLIGTPGAPVLNSKTCRLETGQLSDATVQICNTFSALNEDFYRPISMGRLFERIFSNEFFHPDTSPNRVRQLILRTRQWIANNYLPVEIEHSARGYRLKIHSGIALRIWADQNESGGASMQHKWNLFESRVFHQEKTNRQQIEFLLNQSAASASRFINWAIQEKKLIPLGHGQFELAKSI